MENYYEILELSPQATTEQVRKAYRRLARRLHPDVAGPDSTDRFLQVQRAYEALIDPDSRKAYDEQLLEAKINARRQMSTIINPLVTPLDDDEHAPRQDTGFAVTDKPTAAQRRIQFTSFLVEVVLSPQMAHTGGVVHLDLPVTVVCTRCDETGRSGAFVCSSCGGRIRWADTRIAKVPLVGPLHDGQVTTVDLLADEELIGKLTVRIRLSWF